LVPWETGELYLNYGRLVIKRYRLVVTNYFGFLFEANAKAEIGE